MNQSYMNRSAMSSNNLFLDPADHFPDNIIHHGWSEKGETFESDVMDEELLIAPPKT